MSECDAEMGLAAESKTILFPDGIFVFLGIRSGEQHGAGVFTDGLHVQDGHLLSSDPSAESSGGGAGQEI